MGAQEEANGLSLEGLAQRLETLELENERMRSENAELRSEVAELKGSDTGRAVEEQEPVAFSSQRRVSRSWLLRNAGAAAVGTMAAGALLARDASVAKADHFAPGISVDYVITHLETAGLTAVFGNAPNGEGVVGSGKTYGVRGEGETGVFGKSSTTGFGGVSGQHTGSGFGVVGDGRGANFAGVLGRNSTGHGVRGEGQAGVVGKSSTSGWEGVYGQHTGSGYGVVGDGRGANFAGVLGRNINPVPGLPSAGVRGEGLTGVFGKFGSGFSTGYGVVGEGSGPDWAGVKGTNPSGPGVFGIGSPGVRGAAPDGLSYGGLFEGGKAQLKLVPKSTVGKPTTGAHTKGEIYLDSAGALFVCTASGTPGTWRKVTTTAA